jgi:hypothetical protein
VNVFIPALGAYEITDLSFCLIERSSTVIYFAVSFTFYGLGGASSIDCSLTASLAAGALSLIGSADFEINLSGSASIGDLLVALGYAD